ncbi:hypothetical protein KIPB_005322, partial [Kipferlia bialata]
VLTRQKTKAKAAAPVSRKEILAQINRYGAGIRPFVSRTDPPPLTVSTVQDCVREKANAVDCLGRISERHYGRFCCWVTKSVESSARAVVEVKFGEIEALLELGTLGDELETLKRIALAPHQGSQSIDSSVFKGYRSAVEDASEFAEALGTKYKQVHTLCKSVYPIVTVVNEAAEEADTLVTSIKQGYCSVDMESNFTSLMKALRDSVNALRPEFEKAVELYPNSSKIRLPASVPSPPSASSGGDSSVPGPMCLPVAGESGVHSGPPPPPVGAIALDTKGDPGVGEAVAQDGTLVREREFQGERGEYQVAQCVVPGRQTSAQDPGLFVEKVGCVGKSTLYFLGQLECLDSLTEEDIQEYETKCESAEARLCDISGTMFEDRHIETTHQSVVRKVSDIIQTRVAIMNTDLAAIQDSSATGFNESLTEWESVVKYEDKLDELLGSVSESTSDTIQKLRRLADIHVLTETLDLVEKRHLEVDDTLLERYTRLCIVTNKHKDIVTAIEEVIGECEEVMTDIRRGEYCDKSDLRHNGTLQVKQRFNKIRENWEKAAKGACDLGSLCFDTFTERIDRQTSTNQDDLQSLIDYMESGDGEVNGLDSMFADLVALTPTEAPTLGALEPSLTDAFPRQRSQARVTVAASAEAIIHSGYEMPVMEREQTSEPVDAPVPIPVTAAAPPQAVETGRAEHAGTRSISDTESLQSPGNPPQLSDSLYTAVQGLSDLAASLDAERESTLNTAETEDRDFRERLRHHDNVQWQCKQREAYLEGVQQTVLRHGLLPTAEQRTFILSQMPQYALSDEGQRPGRVYASSAVSRTSEQDSKNPSETTVAGVLERVRTLETELASTRWEVADVAKEITDLQRQAPIARQRALMHDRSRHTTPVHAHPSGAQTPTKTKASDDAAATTSRKSVRFADQVESDLDGDRSTTVYDDSLGADSETFAEMRKRLAESTRVCNSVLLQTRDANGVFTGVHDSEFPFFDTECDEAGDVGESSTERGEPVAMSSQNVSVFAEGPPRPVTAPDDLLVPDSGDLTELDSQTKAAAKKIWDKGSGHWCLKSRGYENGRVVLRVSYTGEEYPEDLVLHLYSKDRDGILGSASWAVFRDAMACGSREDTGDSTSVRILNYLTRPTIGVDAVTMWTDRLCGANHILACLKSKTKGKKTVLPVYRAVQEQITIIQARLDTLRGGVAE